MNLAIASLVLMAQAAAVRVAPPPGWVDPVPPDLAAQPARDARGGIDYLVADDQVRTGPGPVEHYTHRAHRVLSPRGVENGAEFRIAFDPSCQQLAVHAVTLHRRGRRFDALRPSEIKLLQREKDLDRRLFDGWVTAVVVLHDVRQGDVVEASWTVRGTNPALGGRWAEAFSLAYGVPLAHRSVRVVTPAGRELAFKVTGLDLPVEMAGHGSWTAYRWSRRSVPPVDDEVEDLPPGEVLYPTLELSEWRGWDEVRAWARPLYDPDPLSGEVAAKVERWRALPDLPARVLAALRFVQDEVRYLGFEHGMSSFRPHAPAEVTRRRFGDCKDKSLLLVALLRGLGVEAYPALVNTDEAATVVERLPSPRAFDHVIVRASVDGSPLWLEPTRSLERATLASLEPPPYAAALVIGPGGGGFEAIPAPPAARVDVLTTYRVRRFGAPVVLDVETTLLGRRAVSMRHRLAEDTAAGLEKRYLEFYARQDPKIRVVRPLEVEDAEDADRIVLREHYELPPFSAGEEREFLSDEILSALRSSASPLRKRPLRVRHPVAIRERFSVELPGVPALRTDDVVVRGEAVTLERRARVDGNRYTVELNYRTLLPALAAAAVPRHLQVQEDMRGVAAFQLALGVEQLHVQTVPGWSASAPVLLVIFAGLLLLVGIVAALDGTLRRWAMAAGSWRRQRTFRTKLRLEAGEAPAAPLLVRSAEEVAAAAGRLRCSCGERLSPPSLPGESIRFGGRELLACALVCSRCGEHRRTYFALDPWHPDGAS